MFIREITYHYLTHGKYIDCEIENAKIIPEGKLVPIFHKWEASRQRDIFCLDMRSNPATGNARSDALLDTVYQIRFLIT